LSAGLELSKKEEKKKKNKELKMSTKNDYEQSIHVVPFSGKKKEWITQEEKFLAISHIKGFNEIFVMDPDDIPTDSEDLDDDKVAGNNRSVRLAKTIERHTTYSC
jgi:hypothetical protein